MGACGQFCQSEVADGNLLKSEENIFGLREVFGKMSAQPEYIR